ncbi:palmitoyltransferas-like protein akr1, partial [Aulographum hederae CBS 113979]
MSTAASTPRNAESKSANGSPRRDGGGDEPVEMSDIQNAPPKLPIERDLMQLARLGEVGAIQKLFNTGEFDATSTDDEGITALHWAAINDHYALCHFLIHSGANVNAKGGVAIATPVLWAAKRCHYYIVDLLLQNGADPLMTDDQGFNLLHSAALDGNVFQLVMLLHQDIPVDVPDAQGHTSLMWAAYKGFPAVVDLFLKWGADVHARDDQGFTALHWALVKGAMHPIVKLIEYGSNRFAENSQGKTPAITAEEMNSKRQWHRALKECGYNSDGSPKSVPFFIKDRRKFIWRLTFLWPSFILPCVFYILVFLPVYFALPLSIFVAYALQIVAIQTLRWAPPDLKSIHRTPFLAGIFAGSLLWAGLRWFTTILPWTYMTNPFLNLLFASLYSFCAYFYFKTMLSNPGYVPTTDSRVRQKAVIDELIAARKFNEQYFCVTCMVRKPLRSKHCKRCNRCVAKEDHHCPWVDNCVANDNHRFFVLYIVALELGVLSLVWLFLAYLEVIPGSTTTHECNILSPELCSILMKDPFSIVVVGWCCAQLVWVTMLLIVQLVQIGRAQTTYESMSHHKHDPHGMGEAVTSFVTTGTTSMSDASITGGPMPGPSGATPTHHGHTHGPKPRKEGCWGTWKRLLGVDTFLMTALHGSNAANVQARRKANPYTRGLLTNCKDFWCDPAPLFKSRRTGEALLGGERVDWTRVWDVPLRGTEGGRWAREELGNGGAEERERMM